jgi:hypothetical protein
LALPIREEEENPRLRHTVDLERIRSLLGVRSETPESLAASLPFSADDVTAGAENELQAFVAGGQEDVDLPRTIHSSNYYQNIVKRVRSGETPKSVMTDLELFLTRNAEQVWDHSWVRFPHRLLSGYAKEVFRHDLLADKQDPAGPNRRDEGRFVFLEQGERMVRIPISYLLKISVADAISSHAKTNPLVRETGERVMSHFLNDNTSPETFSFSPVSLRPSTGMGRGIARETLKRFLLTYFLTQYANERFGLQASGQKAVVCFAPHPPVRLQQLNDLISDSFYRDLFMSPCLCGWDRGEEKYQYMVLCHQVLSRSNLNAIGKLKEAGIITRNLVILPTVSNVSLANNGTHISLGSRKLADRLGNGPGSFTALDEKYLGDLVIKIVEHFLPLFVGTYSASPYRLDFWDFHPEKVLGFLPHELDFTHLRMIWRRWKGKARLKILGQPLTPFGPKLLDVFVSKLFRLRGDFVQDYRLVNYLVALMSTDQSPALDGSLDNEDRLKKDLADMGVFDPNMSVYLLYKLRRFGAVGFSGFEGRHYSLFENLLEDMGEAASLQTLVTALAFQYILQGEVTHAHIPDDPTVESERRQVFFGSAIGIPTFFVRKDTANRFMLRILARTRKTRMSHRYPGYLRVVNADYRRALLETIQEDAREITRALDLGDTLERLQARIASPKADSAGARLTQGILEEAGRRSPMELSGTDFNLAAERYYRTTLRKRHIREALHVLEEDVRRLSVRSQSGQGPYRSAIQGLFDKGCPRAFLESVRNEVEAETAPVEVLTKLIHLTLLTVHADTETTDRQERSQQRHDANAASVY